MAKKKAERNDDVVEALGTYEAAASEACVSWRGRTRVYTQTIHGDDFINLAKQFCSKVGGTLETR